MASIYKGLNMELTATQIYSFLSMHPDLVTKLQSWVCSVREHARMPANLAEFGLTKAQVEASFGKYIAQFSL